MKLKRQTFNILFIVAFGLMNFLIVEYAEGGKAFISTYIIILGLIAYYAGQYSTKYPKE